ncbi:sugar O-acetyltransferase [Clostridium sp. CTA-5]
MNLREKMCSGKMYNDYSDELIEARKRAVFLTNKYNQSFGKPEEERIEILDELLEKHGKNTHFEPDFRCEFGFNITVGDNFFANFDCIILDCAKVTIGDNVLFGPRVGIYLANHASIAEERNAGACYAKPVTIGNNVWVGAGVHINQGVTIGDNTIIGSGSVVTKDIPANVIAVGNPCKVLREITEADRTDYLETL